MAPPAEPRGEKKLFLCKFWAVKNFQNLLKSAGEIFLSGLRGAKNFSNAFRIVFRILFRVFQTVFRIDLKFFSGAVSFCRHAVRCPKVPELYTPLLLNREKGQYLPVQEVYKNQSPN